jgi:hypothetical protein
MYKLEMNSKKVINEKTYYGPTFRMRGISKNKINDRHAFQIYFIFKGKKLRNLEEGIKVPGICEIEKNIDDNDEKNLNLVQYICIAIRQNNLELNDLDLFNIEEGDNSGILNSENFLEMLNQTNFEDLTNKLSSTFTLEKFLKIVTFELENLKNITAENHIFDFVIKGTINKELGKLKIDSKLELKEIPEYVICEFTIKENKKADLNCKLNVSDYNDIKLLSFKTSEITNGNNDIS